MLLASVARANPEIYGSQMVSCMPFRHYGEFWNIQNQEMHSCNRVERQDLGVGLDGSFQGLIEAGLGSSAGARTGGD
jgi:hypothetical protein